MKFTCSQASLNKAINTVTRAVSVRTTIPILKGILMEVKENTLKMTCSNLDLSIETEIQVQGAEEGSLVISAKLFGEMIRRLPNAMVSASTDERGTLHISCIGSEFSIIGMPSEEYPSIGEVSAIKTALISKEIFSDLVKKTSFAASIDEKKGILIGCLMKFKDESLEMAALDGFRMAVANAEEQYGISGNVILPARILSDISKILGESEGTENIKFSVDEKKVEIICDDTRIIARLLEGDYIKYEDIIPKEYKTRFIISRDELINSIERASLFSKEGKNNLIKMTVADGMVTISSRSEEGNINEHVNAEIEGNGQEIGFNSKYVVDVLKAISDEEIAFEMTNSVSSCLVKPVEGSSYTYLILPVRIS